MRLLVTGAAGFIGSVLCLRAAERYHKVVGLDDLSRGLNILDSTSSLRFSKHDCQGGFYEALGSVEFPGVDVVVHFAAGTGSLDRPMDELRALNVEMTKRVYEDAKALNAKVFVFPTTSLALGVPDSPYVRSKEEAFQWLLGQSRRDPMALLPLRLFNVVGAYKGCSERRKREVHIIPTMVECYKLGSRFVVNGADYGTEDGTPSRTYTNVLDVADFILEALEAHLMSRYPHPDLVYQGDGAVWVGSGHSTTTLQAYAIFTQWVGKLVMDIGPRRPYDCAELLCPSEATTAVSRVVRRPLAPAWVGIRDEAWELLGTGRVSAAGSTL